MKLDLCKVFGVKENQHFWVKHKKFLDKCYVKDNKLWSIGENCVGVFDSLDLFSITEIYYIKPRHYIKITDNTRQFLKIINKRFKYISRDENGEIGLYNSKPKKEEEKWRVNNSIFYGDDWVMLTIPEHIFDIDLSFIKWEDEEPYSISELLGEEQWYI